MTNDRIENPLYIANMTGYINNFELKNKIYERIDELNVLLTTLRSRLINGDFETEEEYKHLHYSIDAIENEKYEWKVYLKSKKNILQ